MKFTKIYQKPSAYGCRFNHVKMFYLLIKDIHYFWNTVVPDIVVVKHELFK